ncbi:MAG: uroporphyrinogen decarboxylase family protein [Eubacteriales bacterium]|nr:uroporphyrinogen decarboxylase family protein [Eubacteriales bacterium]
MKTEMTSRERLMRIFKGEQTDRPALKLWGAGKYSKGDRLLHPDYAPVAAKASEITDLFGGSGSAFDIYYGKNGAGMVSSETRETGQEAWRDNHITYRTPEGELHAIHRWSTVGEPGYVLEYAVKDASDLKKLLSIPYEPFDFADNHAAAEAAMGDRGVVCFGLDHAAYAVHRMTGSETLAFLSADDRGLLDEVISAYSDRIIAHVENALRCGIRAPFAWVGPELFIPPLMSPRDFDDFVLKYDRPLCDLIHNGGGYVWVHCHGKTGCLIDRFIDMGVDILNPLEPPKNGDVILRDVVKKFGNRIGLEGNIEIQDILLAPRDELGALIDECVDAGRESGRFILCPSAGYAEYPRPTAHYIDNLMFYLNYGYEKVTAKN